MGSSCREGLDHLSERGQQLSAVPIFPPDTPGSGVVRRDPTVVLCAPGALYALAVDSELPMAGLVATGGGHGVLGIPRPAAW